MQVEKYVFERHGDERGQLVVIEENRTIPFDIKRVYYMYDTDKDAVRGKHAHKSLQQVLFCIHGSCKLLLDNGKEKETVLLNKPNEGIYISNNIWREMSEFSEDAVLMVLASEYYEESDYIRDYNEFISYVNSQENR